RIGSRRQIAHLAAERRVRVGIHDHFGIHTEIQPRPVAVTDIDLHHPVVGAGLEQHEYGGAGTGDLAFVHHLFNDLAATGSADFGVSLVELSNAGAFFRYVASGSGILQEFKRGATVAV